MSFDVAPPYDPNRAPNPLRLAWALHDAWAAGDWTTFASLLRDDVAFESPGMTRVAGREAVVALFREGRRFPGLTSIEHRRTVVEEPERVARFSEVSIHHERRVSVADLLTVEGGRVAYWFSLSEAWPPE